MFLQINNPLDKVQVESTRGELTVFLLNWFKNLGMSENMAEILNTVSILIVIVILSIVADYLAKKSIVNTIKRIVSRTKTNWDDIIVERKVFNRIAHFAPAIIIHYSIGMAFRHYPNIVDFVQTLIYIYVTVIAVLVIQAFLRALNDIYRHSPLSKNRPIKGYLQLINIFVVIVAILLIYSYLTGNEIKGVLAGLGAMAAVIMLVFKDTILGLSASIQLSANNMVNIGDWITMPSHGADGEVLEITLNTVKVQNWDKTITTIPTYALVAESFSNWRGMEESDGRRIKRSVNIDMRSVKFCSPELTQKLAKIDYLKDYVANKADELEKYNKSKQVDESILANGRRMTNLGTFRKYMESYLGNNPMINKEMTFLVRQLQPNEKGIPMEFYVFSKDQEWANYEAIQSDIFDHVLAVLPEFELRVFQNPTGYDFEKFNE